MPDQPTAYCDERLATETLEVMSGLAPYVGLESGSAVTTDPRWSGSTARVTARVENPWQDPVALSFSVRRADGGALAGPYPLSTATPTALQVVRSVPANIRALAGAPVADGVYAVEVTSVRTHDGVSQVATSAANLRVFNDPPTERPTARPC